ncbi:MAG: metal ABC transporter permease [Planctomycetota bacterium]
MRELFTTVASFASSYWATLALGALCAYLGVFTVLRRIVFTGAALAQAAAAGVAASFWVLTLPLPAALHAFVTSWGATLGSLGASVGSALALARGERRGRLTADALVGVVFAASSALAVLLVWRSSKGLVELKNILAGDVLLSSSGDLVSLWFGVAGVAVLHAFLRSRFLLVAYDPPFARAQGLDVRNLERAFLASLAVAVAVALRAAGLMLVFGTLVLTPLVGLRVAGTLGRATWVAVGAAWSSTLGGFLLATHQNLPVAPTIVACEVALLVAAMLLPRTTQAVCLAGGVCALAAGAVLAAMAPERVPTQLSAADFEPTGAHSHRHGAGHSAGHGPRRAVEVHLAALADLALSDEVRIRAVEALGTLRAPEAVRPLIEAMGEPFEDLALRARTSAVALGREPSGEGLNQLLVLADGPDAELATHAARVLVEMEHEGAWSLLVRGLADSSVPLLLREETHAFLTETNDGDPLGYDAFAEPVDNAEALDAWRAWAASR